MKTNTLKYTSNFKKIIDVQIFHTYYLDNNCPAFTIAPSKETLMVLKNYGLLFRQLKNGFTLIMNNDFRFASPAFKGEVVLSFVMENNDPYFLNYTNIPIEAGKRMVFKNKGTAMNLHQESFVDGACYVDSDLLFDGVIYLTINSENEFFGHNTVNKQLPEQQFKISFDAREIKYRYNFYSKKPMREFDNFFITDEDTSFKNIDFKKRYLASGTEVYSVIQGDYLKLFERNPMQYFLKKDDEYINSFSIALPAANVKSITYDAVAKIFYADCFVSVD